MFPKTKFFICFNELLVYFSFFSESHILWSISPQYLCIFPIYIKYQFVFNSDSNAERQHVQKGKGRGQNTFLCSLQWDIRAYVRQVLIYLLLQSRSSKNPLEKSFKELQISKWTPQWSPIIQADTQNLNLFIFSRSRD